MRKLLRGGEPFIWLTGSALAVSLVMITGLLLLIVSNGLGFFWPDDIVRLRLADGTTTMGQIRKEEEIPDPDAAKGTIRKRRLQLQTGNRDLTGQDFRWIDLEKIQGRDAPPQAVLLERREWGPFFGELKEIQVDGTRVASGASDESWAKLTTLIDEYGGVWERLHRIERDEIGDITHEQEALRLELRAIERRGRESSRGRVAAVEKRIGELQVKYAAKNEERNKLSAEMARARAAFVTAEGTEKEIPVWTIVRAVRPNSTGFFGKVGVYVSRFWEFIFDEPRESNTEGGIFPAIFGTVMMVFLMTLCVVPLGVLAALYLREYAKQGPLVRAVRIAVNNLAGVPSIVFGVFGLGFFVYFVGGTIDQLFHPDALPTPTYGTGGILWASLTLALLTVPVVIVATEEGLAAVPKDIRHGSLALGATKFETMWRVVIPNAMPGILTGVILAMARAAGEVAPLMITGVVKLAPAMPLDGHFPYLHLDRKFMHLGFHIYDVGFQSPNVEAARPMVYTTTLLLLVIVVVLNLVAIWIRNRLRRAYRSSAF